MDEEVEIIADSLKGKEPIVYCFWWGDDSNDQFIMEIWAREEEVKELLNKYRASDPEGYNNADWMDFLRSRGIRCRMIVPDYYIYF
jgi:hypothetical protein